MINRQNMRKTLLISIICIFFLSVGFQSHPVSSFEKGKRMFERRNEIGDGSEWKKADSIFLSIYSKDKADFSNVETIQAVIFRLEIRQHSGDYYQDFEKTKEDLKLIDHVLSKNPQLETHNINLFVQLKHFQKRISLFQNESGAMEALKDLFNKYSTNPSVEKYVLSSINESIAKKYNSEKDFKFALYYGLNTLKLIPTEWEFKKIAFKRWVGGAYYNDDKIDSCLILMKEAYSEIQDISEEFPNTYEVRGGLAFNIGMIYQGKTGNYHESETYLKEAIKWEILANGEKSSTLITYYSLLADTYFRIKDLQKAEFYALKAYSQANEVVKTESVYLKSLASMSMSRIYVQKENYEAARNLMDKVLAESLDFFGKDDKFTTQVYIDKAYIEQAAGDFTKAEKYYLLAAESGMATQRIYSIDAAYTSLISMYLKIENYEEALKYGLLSWELTEEHLQNDYLIKAQLGLQLVRIYLGLNQLDHAKAFLKRAEEVLAVNTHTQQLDLELLSLKNSILFKEYQIQNNRTYLEKAHQNIQPIMDLIIKGKSDFNYQNSKLFYSQSVSEHILNSIEIATEFYKLNPEIETLNTLFKLIEINKSTILLDGMMDFEIKEQKGVPVEILEKEKELAIQLGVLNREIARMENDSLVSKQNLQKILDDRIQIDQEIEKNQEYLKRNHSSYFQAKNLLLSENIYFYQANSLESHQAFLEYFVGKDRIYRLFITNNSIDFQEIEGLEGIRLENEKLVENLLERKSVDHSSSFLAKELIPIIPEGITDLVIISDEFLNQIPFEILPYEQGILLEKLNVSYAGSVQLYAFQKQMTSKKKRGGKWTGFAPEFVHQPLPNNKFEVEKIRNLTDGVGISGKKATKDSFLKEAPKASILHLATHSEIDKVNPMLSKMYFYDEGEEAGELTASEIYNLDFNAKMIVLSACSTGIGKSESGDGVMSMARAFTYAGINSAVMSLWKVSDKETADLMVLFYENLEKGQTKNEAIRNAKLTYLKTTTEPELLHPYYWAGFVVTGDVSPLKDDSHTWLYVLGIMGLIGFLVYFWKSKVFQATP